MSAPRFPNAPERIRDLPLDARGYPVPWFVAWIDGRPDFRVIREGGIAQAHNKSLCWICGERRGRFGAFVIGPMCAVNRVSAEPPSHLSCATFAAEACPFLAQPKMKRNERDLPAEHEAPAGEMIRRNPGVALVWVSRGYKPFRDGRGGWLFDVGEPSETFWFAHGRPATRAEVMASIESGLPLLRGPAEREGPKAVAALERMTADALNLVPAE